MVLYLGSYKIIPKKELLWSLRVPTKHSPDPKPRCSAEAEATRNPRIPKPFWKSVHFQYGIFFRGSKIVICRGPPKPESLDPISINFRKAYKTRMLPRQKFLCCITSDQDQGLPSLEVGPLPHANPKNASTRNPPIFRILQPYDHRPKTKNPIP